MLSALIIDMTITTKIALTCPFCREKIAKGSEANEEYDAFEVEYEKAQDAKAFHADPEGYYEDQYDGLEGDR